MREIKLRGPCQIFYEHNKIKMARQGSKSVEVLHFYYLLARSMALAVDMREIKLRGPCQIFYEHNKIKMARQGSKSVEVLHFYYLLARSMASEIRVLTRSVLFC